MRSKHQIFWETVTVILMVTALIGVYFGWDEVTAIAGASIAASTLALVRKA